MSRVTIPALVSQLLHDGVDLARAEVRLARARLTIKLAEVKVGAIFLAAAALVAFLGLIGLVVGVVMALATLVGPGLAGLIVLVVALLIAGVLGWLGAKRLSAKPEPITAPTAPLALESRV